MVQLLPIQQISIYRHKGHFIRLRGSYLFLIYVNDIESAVDCNLLLYADDSALLIRGKNIIDIEQKLSEEPTKLNVWLIDNKLSLHLGKTESISRAAEPPKVLYFSSNPNWQWHTTIHGLSS